MYRIEFPDRGIVQYKVLISHEDYLKVKSIKDDDEYKSALKQLTGGKEWFTEKSPYYIAITTGRFICNSSDVPCIVTNHQIIHI